MSSVFPTLRQVYYTPWQDMLRFRLTSQLDWKSQIEKSNLPLEVQQIITDLVVRTRLLRTEKTSVADELIAHFQDGNDCGFSYEDLLKDFGDIQVTAQLIRRGKERNRPVILKLAKILGLTATVTAIAMVAMSLFFLLGKANPNINYIADLNVIARQADEANKAWPIYRDSWIEHRFVNMSIDDLYHTDPESGAISRLLRPTDEAWPQAVSFLKEKEDLLAAFREGSRKPVFGLELHYHWEDYSELDQQAIFPGEYEEKLFGDGDSGDEQLSEIDELMDSSVIGVLLPHIQALRSGGIILHGDTRLAIEENDPRRAIENIEATFGIARQATDSPILVCALVGLAIADKGFEQIEDILVEHPDFFTLSDLEYLQSLVREQDFGSFVRFDGEKALFYDIIQRSFTDNGKGDGRLTYDGLKLMYSIVPALTGFDSPKALQHQPFSKIIGVALASRKETIDSFDQFISLVEEDFAKPIYEQPNRITASFEKIIEQGSGNQMFLESLVPAFEQVGGAVERRIALQDATELAIAIERFRRQFGEPPQQLDELVPDFIREVAKDRVTGGWLNYVLVEGQPTIYSIGNDGKDDGGIPLVDENGAPAHLTFVNSEQQYAGDWILWPQRND